MHVYRLKHATVTVHPEHRNVVTTFSGWGLTCTAAREDTPENRREATDEGYDGDVWRCLVNHELAHSYWAQRAWDIPSPSLMTEAGQATPAPYDLRLWEESLVIGFQKYVQGQGRAAQLEQWKAWLPLWRADFVEWFVGAHE